MSDPVFVETAPFLHAQWHFQFTRNTAMPVWISGTAGVGKTEILLALARRNKRTFYVRVPTVYSSPAEFFRLCCRAINLPVDERKREGIITIEKHLTWLQTETVWDDNVGEFVCPKPVFLIDEADKLDVRAMKDFQELCWEMKVGLLMAGNSEMLSAKRKGQRRIAPQHMEQTGQRIAIKINIGLPGDGEIIAIADANFLLDGSERTYRAILEYARMSSLRDLHFMLSMAQNFATTNCPITLSEIDEAASARHSSKGVAGAIKLPPRLRRIPPQKVSAK